VAKKILFYNPDSNPFTDSTWFPYSLKLGNLIPKQNNNDIVKICHFATDRKIKGTDIVEEAVKGLKAKFTIVEKMPYNEAMSVLSNSDIVAGQMLMGIYGQAEAEALALGKPVVIYIKPEFLDVYPKLPFVLCEPNPKSMRNEISWLIEDETERKRIGKKGRRFAEKYHDYISNARKLKKIYKA